MTGAAATYDFVPLIAPKSLREHTPESFLSYLKTLYICPKEELRKKNERLGKKPASDLGFRTNDKGTQIITVRNRKPKWATKEEIRQLAGENGLSQQEAFVLFNKKKIEIRTQAKEQNEKD